MNAPQRSEADIAPIFTLSTASDGAHASAAGPQQLGFKAYNLGRMAGMGLPVPPAFVLSTDFCRDPQLRQRAGDPALWRPALRALEAASGLRFGGPCAPLLLSVRSGAAVSMPGMMETLLNVGLNEQTVQGLIRLTGNPRLAWDAYRRLIASYGELVAGLPAALFEDLLQELLAEQVEPCQERELDFRGLRSLCRRYQAAYAREVGEPFPQQPEQQLARAIEVVLRSWDSARARHYRQAHGIDEGGGTAVTVQSMVFGNAGPSSGAGVGFTRNPATGEPGMWLDFLFNAQGEDVVSGRRSAHGDAVLQQVLPAIWTQLQASSAALEREFGDMQDFEFTVQQGRLYLLQTRSGKRSATAAVRIALDLLREGLIDAPTALARCAGIEAAQLRSPYLRALPGQPLQILGRAASASPGVAVGEIALDAERAWARCAAGAPVVLLRRDADTGDVAALEHAQGLLTMQGARTSHAAVVARQMGKVCLVGCAGLQIDESARLVRFADASPATPPLREGDLITLDGHEGVVYAGALDLDWRCPDDLLQALRALRQAQPPSAG
ncbi:PEP/pyruvate-binding domain-containing protein [Kinneretia asaccharophila]|uniref:Pyruvate phosphate dikinase n=1 Tax=Roseateles asaccharophilus TaxID=582607 RepID=A0A4R6MZC2_9BURK|nr:PEP/pyruvate-binding domain-containing protein [Roseateles asaccharophilus]MDN3545819.1 PEP/pyruvate-binding domain-containing protein [Roseateles asaccharophilus]TDP07686.1 pyruvate phosphate dikinase [Roseateles asaccharophilus]